MTKRTVTFILALALLLTVFSGCAKKKTEINADPAEIWADIEKLCGDELPLLEDLGQDAFDSMLGIYDGDLADKLESYVYRIPLMNVHASEIFIGKAKNGKVEDVKSALEKRLVALDEIWSRYLPDQYELVKNAKLRTNGNYILLVVSDQADKITDIFDIHTT